MTDYPCITAYFSVALYRAGELPEQATACSFRCLLALPSAGRETSSFYIFIIKNIMSNYKFFGWLVGS
jgi:hypothetical protein